MAHTQHRYDIKINGKKDENVQHKNEKIQLLKLIEIMEINLFTTVENEMYKSKDRERERRR